MIAIAGLGIDALRDRPAPFVLVPQHLEQRAHEFRAADLGEEFLRLRHRGFVAVGERQFEPEEQHFVIAGLGQTGLSCVRYLQQQSVAFKVWDTRAGFSVSEELAAQVNADITCGELPQHQNIFVLTALGSKGWLWGPWTAKLLQMRLQNEKEIDGWNVVDLMRANAEDGWYSPFIES